MKLLKNNFYLILIIILASTLRLLWLDKIPNAIGGDELTYIVTAKSIVLNFSDLTQVWDPFSVFSFHYPPGELQAELPYFLLAPFVGYVSFSLFTARILYAILSILTVLLIYLISEKFFDKKVALFAGFIAAINPWSIYIGRTNYEVVPAIFFFLLSFYFLLIFKGWRILISLPFLFFAFYSYIGTKLIFIPFVLISLYFSYLLNKKKYLKQYLIVFITSFLLVIFFVFSAKTGSVGVRTGEIFLPNNPFVSNEVNIMKKASIQTPALTFFLNKASVYIKIIENKFLNSFSFNYLFMEGDTFYKIGHGFFYVIDLIFLILGLIFAFMKKKKEFILLLVLVILGVMPQVFNTSKDLENFAPHIAFSFPFLMIFIGVGLSYFFDFARKNKAYLYLFIVFCLVYLFSFLSFFQLYFFRFPLQGHFDFEVRLMSKYVALANQTGQSITIYSPKYEDEFRKYIFYSDSLSKKTSEGIARAIKTKDYRIGNIRFLGCNNEIDPLKEKGIVAYNYICGKLETETKYITIPRLLDGGESYRIYKDNICSEINLNQYPIGISVDDFGIEQMPREKFCQRLITSF